MRNQGYTGTNAKGNELWAKLISYTAKEYLMFTGSDSFSYIQNHSFAVLSVAELNMGGSPVRMVQMRNPWKGDDGWKGDYSEVKGGEKWSQLKAALKISQGGIKVEAGKFWMSFEDFVKEYSRFYVGFSQESRTAGGVERAEYRPTVDLDAGSDKHYTRITLYEDLDLTEEVFQIENLQGGNRVGTVQNKAVQKFDTGSFSYVM